jgi:hypothetical protein
MKDEIIEKLAALITAAFGLVAALAWNEAIQGLFKSGGPFHFISHGGPWIYAVMVTVLAVLATIWIGQAVARARS